MSKSEAGPRISKTSVSSELFVQQMVPDSHRRVEPEQVVASNQSPGGKLAVNRSIRLWISDLIRLRIQCISYKQDQPLQKAACRFSGC